MCRWLLVVFLVLPCLAHAGQRVDRYSELTWQADATRATASMGRGGGASPTGPAAKSTPTGAAFHGQKALPWPGKNEAMHMAKWRLLAEPRELAKAVMNPASAAGTLIGGLLIKQLLDQACVRMAGGTLRLAANGLWEECIFIEQPTLMYRGTANGVGHMDGPWHTTKAAAANGFMGLFRKSGPANCTWGGQDIPFQWELVIHAGNFEMIRRCAQYPGGDPVSYFANWLEETKVVQTPNGWKDSSSPVVETKIANKVNEWCQLDFTNGLGSGDGQCSTLVGELMANGHPVETQADPEVSEGPDFFEGTPHSTTTIAPDGKKTVTESREDSKITYDGDTVTRTPTVSTRVKVYDADGNLMSDTTTTTETSDTRSACEKDPNHASCPAQQGGTTGTTMDGEQKAADVLKPLTDFVKDPKAALPSLPVLNWSFQLPSGCTAIALPAFAPYLQSIDICPFVDMFHSIMNIVWIMGGLFGAISMFWRNTLSQA